MVDKFNYKELGFKCGIEIHQQIDTPKLYCDCPSIIHDDNSHIVVKRKLRAVVGETGEIDAAASFEQSKQKTIAYEGCSTSYCLVELDEEPPHSLNQDAVAVAIQVAKMLHATIVDQIQVMRKTVVDGSNVSGFQRTALVAVDGYIETSKGKVMVPTICVEEESAKKISTTESEVVYRLDRLGVGLIELATDASIQDPLHAQECAGILGMILRSTGKVKRGIGSIRQDVNVSIMNGSRVEIKGFQDLRSIPEVVDFEIHRQKELIDSGKPVAKEVRKAEPNMTTSFMRPMPGAARMYPETDVLPIRLSKEFIDSIHIPKLLSEQKDELTTKYKLDQGIVKELVDAGYDLEMYHTKYSSFEPAYIASVLVQIPIELRRKENVDVSNLTEEDFMYVFDLLSAGKITKQHVSEILKHRATGGVIDLSKYAPVDDSVLEKEIADIVAKNPGKPQGAYMGMVMAALKGKADGKKTMELLKKVLG